MVHARKPATYRSALVAAAALGLALATPTASPASAAESMPPTELLGDGSTVIPLVDEALIQVSDYGLRYIAGQQNSNLTITMQGDKIRYADTGTGAWKRLPRECQKVSVRKGIAAVCSVPAKWRDASEMFLEVWPRLGNDTINAATMPSKFRLWVLTDEGNDTVLTGAGDDFVNGAQGDDRINLGAGNDWSRGGIGTNAIVGGVGEDRLVGGDERDTLVGEEGNDTLYGGTGNDTLYGGAGADKVVGAEGYDVAYIDSLDKVNDCEKVVTG